MLVLARKENEVINIYKDGVRVLSLTICALRCDKVRLGFEAADDVEIVRLEIDDKAQPAAA